MGKETDSMKSEMQGAIKVPYRKHSTVLEFVQVTDADGKNCIFLARKWAMWNVASV